jgi:hypothetical protein
MQKKLKDLLDVSMQESDGPPPPNALEYMQLKEAAQRLNKEVERWKKKVSGHLIDEWLSVDLIYCSILYSLKLGKGSPFI